MSFRTVKCGLQGLSPVTFSRYHATPKKSGEAHDAYEERTWREKLTCDDDGFIILPLMALKQSLNAAATYDPIKLGKGFQNE